MEYEEVKKIFSICGNCIMSEVLNTISITKSTNADALRIVINDIIEFNLTNTNHWIIFEELPKEDVETPILTNKNRTIKIKLSDIERIQIFVIGGE